MPKPKITYILTNIYAQTTSSGTLSTTPSTIYLDSTAKFNSFGYGYIEANNLRYEFYYSGKTANSLTGAKLLQTGAVVNYSAGARVYPVFEIYPENFIDYVRNYEQDRDLLKGLFTGNLKDKFRGYYFSAELIYDKIPLTEHAQFSQLFNKYADEIYFFPDKDMPSRFRVIVAEPHTLEDFRQIAYKNFRIKFQSIRRYEHGFEIADKWRWGNKVVIFNDRETHTSGVSWHDVMIEQNNKDTNLLNNITTLQSNINNHLTNSNPHGTSYYTKSEVDALLKGKQILTFAMPSGTYPNNGYMQDASGANYIIHLKGLKGQILKVAFKGSVSGLSEVWDVSLYNYILNGETLAVYKNDYDNGGTPPVYFMRFAFIKNGNFWFALEKNYNGYYPNEDNVILTVFIKNIDTI